MLTNVCSFKDLASFRQRRRKRREKLPIIDANVRISLCPYFCLTFFSAAFFVTFFCDCLLTIAAIAVFFIISFHSLFVFFLSVFLSISHSLSLISFIFSFFLYKKFYLHGLWGYLPTSNTFCCFNPLFWLNLVSLYFYLS